MWLIIPFLLVLHIGVCLLMVLSVLMQLPRSEGLGAAFGGGVTENIFGAQTTNVLAKFTTSLGIAFFVITLALAVAYSHQDASKQREQRNLMNTQLAGAVAQPSPAASPAAAQSAATPEAQASPAPAVPAQAAPVAPSPAPSPVTP